MGLSGGVATVQYSDIFKRSLIRFLLYFACFLGAPNALANDSVEEFSVHIGPYGYAPFIILDKSTENPRYSGIAYDIISLFEKRFPEYKRTHVLLTRKRANTLMAKGAVVDLMFNSPLFVAPEILEYYEFSNILITTKDVVVTRQDKRFEYTGPSDLYGMSVGAIRGYSYGAFDRLFSQGSIEDIRVDDHKQAIGMLEKGRVDAYFGNIYVSPYYMKTMGLDSSDFVFSNEVMYEFDFGFLVNRNKPKLLKDLNRFIESVMSDGTLDDITKRYLN